MSVLQLRDILLFVVPIVLAAAMLAVLHWYPWHSGVRELGRIEAYTMGTVVVVGMPVSAMLMAEALGIQHGQQFWAALLVVNTAVCGATVRIAYWIDEGKAISLDEGSNHERHF